MILRNSATSWTSHSLKNNIRTAGPSDDPLLDRPGSVPFLPHLVLALSCKSERRSGVPPKTARCSSSYLQSAPARSTPSRQVEPEISQTSKPPRDQNRNHSPGGSQPDAPGKTCQTGSAHVCKTQTENTEMTFQRIIKVFTPREHF